MSKIPKNEFAHEILETLNYDTPYFLFSKKKILDKFAEFKKNFPRASIHYAMKANSEPEILKILAEAGSGFEVASKYELDLLKKLKVQPSKIVYGTSVKPATHIEDFVEYGVERYAFDSMPELEKISSKIPGAKVYVRTIVNDSGSVFKFSEKFGTDYTNIVQLLSHAKELKLIPYGISFHVGSQASDVKAWASAIKMLAPVLRDLKNAHINIEVLNLGGGYPAQYASSMEVPSLEEIAKYVYAEYKKLPYQPKLILEPGRGMIAHSGILVASVIARIERKGYTWLFLDAGAYNGLFESMAYQGSTRFSVTSMRPVGDSGESLFALAGPTGDSPDVITHEALLPGDIEVGDKLIFHNVGAYNLFFASTFNGFPKPSVYTI